MCGIEFIIKTSNSFDLEVVLKLKESSLNLDLGLKAIVIDLDMYYDLALEIIKSNRDENNLFIFFCDKLLDRYKSLYSFARVDIEERVGSILNSSLRIESIIRAVKTFKIRKEEAKNIMSLCEDEITFSNNENHNLNVSVLTKEMLSSLSSKGLIDISEDDIRLIALAAMLHDIGKLYIPNDILLKPSKLTKDEYDIVKYHTILGAKMIENKLNIKNKRLKRYSIEVARWHHERIDGGGYPDHLAKDEIPISALVVGLADSFDALTSKRPYKEKISNEVALCMIKSGECGCFNKDHIRALEEILA